MPGGFQLGYGAQNLQSAGANLASSAGTTVTASSSANTKGSYTEIISTTASDAFGFMLMVTSPSSRMAIDIAFGASGSETVIVGDIFVVESSTAPFAYFFPIQIPAGTRIAARCQSTTGSATVGVALILMDGSFDSRQALAQATTYGFTSSTTQGVTVTTGALDTKGSWAEIASSITADIRYLVVCCRFNIVNTNFLLDIGIGASGSEVVLVPNINGINNSSLREYEVSIPSGTRLAARAQAASSAVVANLVLIGLG